MPTGTVKFYNEQKGYGFIAPDGGGNDVFVHATALERAGLSGFTSATAHNHYGMLRTVEDTFGLGCLANSCSAAPLSEFMP